MVFRHELLLLFLPVISTDLIHGPTRVNEPEQHLTALPDGQKVGTGKVIPGPGVAVLSNEHSVVFPLLQVSGTKHRHLRLAPAEVVKALFPGLLATPMKNSPSSSQIQLSIGPWYP